MPLRYSNTSLWIKYSTFTQHTKNQIFFLLVNNANMHPGPSSLEIPHHHRTRSQTCSFWIFKPSLHSNCATQVYFFWFFSINQLHWGVTRWISTSLDLAWAVKKAFLFTTMLSCVLFHFMFHSLLKPKSSCSSFQGHPSTVSYSRSQNDINTSMFSPQQDDLYS